MLNSVHQESFTPKVPGPCQCTDLLTMTPSQDEMAGLKVKSHLEALMGTDIIRLNDREYMLTLQNQLMAEYDNAMNKQEEQRSEKERRRQRRLYIEGLQDLPNIDQKDIKTRGASISKSSASRPGAPKRNTSGYPDSEEEGLMNPTIGLTTNPSNKKSKDAKAKPFTERRSSKSSQPNQQQTCAIRLASREMTPTDKRNIRERYSSATEDYDQHSQRAMLLRQLKRENTVKGLYRTAEMVMNAPIAKLKSDQDSVPGSPHGSVSTGGTQEN